MPKDKPPPSLKDLETRLKRVRDEREQPESGWGHVPPSSLGRALHLAIEMAAALAVGVGVGWFLDNWLGTKPWLLVVFVLLGFGASLRNAFRLAKRYGAELEEKDDDGDADGPRGENK